MRDEIYWKISFFLHILTQHYRVSCWSLSDTIHLIRYSMTYFAEAFSSVPFISFVQTATNQEKGKKKIFYFFNEHQKKKKILLTIFVFLLLIENHFFPVPKK